MTPCRSAPYLGIEAIPSVYSHALTVLTSGSRLARAASVVAALSVGGCLDAPTVPDALQQIAGGEAWIAVPEPRSLPSTETWVLYLAEGARGAAARDRIDRLRAEARNAAREGAIDWAAQLEAEAARVAVLSLDRSPDPQVMAAAVRSVAEWADRVDSGVDLRVYPDVAASLRRVERSLEFARSALEVGDTTTAVIQLSAASERIRLHGPASVAMRVLTVAEARLRERAPGPIVLERAVHLIRSARHELIDGDPSRALRRALYALQLAESR